jgi:hypothetical protein
MWPASGPHARRKLSALQVLVLVLVRLLVLVLVRQPPQLAEPEQAQGALQVGQPPVPEQAPEQKPLPHGEHRPPSAHPRG